MKILLVIFIIAGTAIYFYISNETIQNEVNTVAKDKASELIDTAKEKAKSITEEITE